MSIEAAITINDGANGIIRGKKLIINNPKDGEPTVVFRVERVVEIDDTPVGTLRMPNISRKVNDVSSETRTVTDPVVGGDVTVSIEGMHLLISAFFNDWYNEDNP